MTEQVAGRSPNTLVVGDLHADSWWRVDARVLDVTGLGRCILDSAPDLLIVAGDIANDPIRNWTFALREIDDYGSDFKGTRTGPKRSRLAEPASETALGYPSEFDDREARADRGGVGRPAIGVAGRDQGWLLSAHSVGRGDTFAAKRLPQSGRPPKIPPRTRKDGYTRVVTTLLSCFPFLVAGHTTIRELSWMQATMP